MMIDNVSVEFESASRFALPLTESVVRILIPERNKGVYLLLRGGQPVYVGRSDFCVRTRLSCHVGCTFASHFVWQPVEDCTVGYFLEAFLFHKLGRSYDLSNVRHPALPAGGTVVCPFCGLN